MAWQRPTLDTLIQRAKSDLNSRLTGTDATLRRSNTNALAIMHSGATHGLYGFLAWIAKQIPYDTAEEELLERWASIWKVFRKSAEYAAGPVIFTGTTGTVIPEKTEMLRSDGVIYTLDNDVTLAADTVTGTITASEAGSSGNADAGVKLSLINTIDGVLTSVTVGGDGLTGGVDKENIDDLRARFIRRLQHTPQGGDEDDYEGWALEVPGVTRAWCFRKQFGGGTVGLTFVCDNQENSIIPSNITAERVAAHIETVRPVTDDVTVYAPVADLLDLTIQLIPGTDAVKAAVNAELTDLLAREAKPEGTILLSHLKEAISIASGEEDHKLISPVADVMHAVGHIAVLGAIIWV